MSIEDSCEFVPFGGICITKLIASNEKLTAAFPGVSIDELIEYCEKLTAENEKLTAENKNLTEDLDIIHDLRVELASAKYANVLLHQTCNNLREELDEYKEDNEKYREDNEKLYLHNGQLIELNEELRAGRENRRVIPFECYEDPKDMPALIAI